MLSLLFLFLSLLLIAACGLFVASEFSMISVNREKINHLAKNGDLKAIKIKKILSNLSTHLSGAQLGITATSILIGILAEPSIHHLIEPVFLQFNIDHELSSTISTIIGIFLATFLTMIFGELVPKNIALSRPLKTARFTEQFISTFTYFTYYPIKLLNGSANLILKKYGFDPIEELASARSADELLSLVKYSAQEGTLSKDMAIMIEKSLEFGDLSVIEVMIPRPKVVTILSNQSVLDLFELSQATTYSQFPVMNALNRKIVGIVHIKDAMKITHDNRPITTVDTIMNVPIFIPSNIEIDEVMNHFKLTKQKMAIAIDEFGEMDGIVTSEDLMEELVGEIVDEHADSNKQIKKRKNGSWVVSGLMRQDEIYEATGILLPEEEDSDTISGLIIYHLRRIPKPGDATICNAINSNDQSISVKLKVLRMDYMRIDKIEVSII